MIRVYVAAMPHRDDRFFGDHVTHCGVYQASASNGHGVLTMLIEYWLDSGRSLPPPQVFADERTSIGRVPA